MRIIEFRLFDTTSKKMYYMPNIGEYTIEQIFRFAETDDPYTKAMQFTGLLDKNGVKIFEGDIVNCVNSIYDQYRNHSTKWLAGVEVFITNVDGVVFGSSPYRTCSNIEIIGNIHEVK